MHHIVELPFINYTYSVEHKSILIQIVPLYVCYMFRPVLRPPFDMSIQKSYKGCIELPEYGLSTGRNM
jgi:hypothetical protein